MVAMHRYFNRLLFAALVVLHPSGALPQSSSAPSAAMPLFDTDAHVALSAYRGMVEEHITGISRTLGILAKTSEGRSADTHKFKPLLSKIAADLPTAASVWFVFPDGRYFSTTNDGIAKELLSDRPYFQPLLSGKAVTGDLVISKSTGHRSIVLAEPVLSKGKVVGGVGVSLRVRLLSERVVEHLPLPPTAYFYALQHDTRIVLHQKAERMFKTPADVGDEALGDLFKRVIQNTSGSFEYKLHGKRMSAIFERSKTLDWYFFIAIETPDNGATQ
ncbi:MAG: hypothetical protein EBZ48_02335 [Proteobacteria bacterium]|nr:hypothetical protein [Pseudomonadota bacterium]